MGEEHPLQGHVSHGQVSHSQGKGQLEVAVQDGKGLQGQQNEGLSSGKPQERALTRTGAC